MAGTVTGMEDMEDDHVKMSHPGKGNMMTVIAATQRILASSEDTKQRLWWVS
jgi:hypothetical protein